ncbi:hypothetical protein Q5O24_12430 [Eubacteriaceae bacterium ES3]|nr:hypothetical protein Q5O24_12430 [Eubacteriaceae bacterium ES3]
MRLLETHQNPPKPDYDRIYINAFARCALELENNPDDRDSLKRSIYYLVKYLNCIPKAANYNELQSQNVFIQTVNYMIGKLSPAEFMTIFPITKTYGGERYEMKDYFYTMEKIKEHGLNKPIGDEEAVTSFLWDYVNIEVRLFMVRYMEIISRFSEFHTGKSTLERFIENEGLDLPIYRQYEDENGNSYLVDGNGRSVPVVKKFPDYIKLLH